MAGASWLRLLNLTGIHSVLGVFILDLLVLLLMALNKQADQAPERLLLVLLNLELRRVIFPQYPTVVEVGCPVATRVARAICPSIFRLGTPIISHYRVSRASSNLLRLTLLRSLLGSHLVAA